MTRNDDLKKNVIPGAMQYGVFGFLLSKTDLQFITIAVTTADQ
jgi:hypothetical protein